MIPNNWLNPEYLSDEKNNKLQTSFSTNKPFSHLELPHFLKQERIIELLQALSKQEFYPKQSDLFHRQGKIPW